MTMFLGLCLNLMATITLIYAGVTATDWKYWVITICFPVGYYCIARFDSERKGG